MHLKCWFYSISELIVFSKILISFLFRLKSNEMWYSIDCLLGKERIEPRRFLLSATAFLGHFF